MAGLYHSHRTPATMTACFVMQPVAGIAELLCKSAGSDLVNGLASHITLHDNTRLALGWSSFTWDKAAE